MQVLDHGFVTYVDHHGGDLSVVNAARVSFGKSTETLDPQKDPKLIEYLAEHDHAAPFRHSGLTMRIKMPIFVMRQFVRHRIGVEISEISGRYAELSEEWYTPAAPGFRAQSSDRKQGSEGYLDPFLQESYLNDYANLHRDAFNLYRKFIRSGMAKEQARMVLPLSVYTEIYVTMSLEAIAHFVHLREDSHAQWEIQQYGIAIKELTLEKFPVAFGALMRHR